MISLAVNLEHIYCIIIRIIENYSKDQIWLTIIHPFQSILFISCQQLQIVYSIKFLIFLFSLEISQANKKGVNFEDAGLDLSSGSDFDDDEDPDKIEVPGGGRDLATAVSFSKHTVVSNDVQPIFNSDIKSTVVNDVKPIINSNSMDSTSFGAANSSLQQTLPSLKHLIPAESILKPFLPKVNTASTRVHPPSTTTNITAASNSVMSYSNSYGTSGITTPSITQGKEKLVFRLKWIVFLCVLALKM